MMGIADEQLAIIATAIIGLVSAVAVALIKKKPEPKTQVDEYGFFYDQYQILYESVLKDAETLRIKKDSLVLQVEQLEKKIEELEETIILYEKEIEEINNELQYWVDEAKTAYKIIDKEL